MFLCWVSDFILDSNLISFQANADKEGSKYSKFLNAKQASKEIMDESNAEEIAEAMKNLLKSFKDQFEKIGDSLSPFLKYGKKEKFDPKAG